MSWITAKTRTEKRRSNCYKEYISYSPKRGEKEQIKEAKEQIKKEGRRLKNKGRCGFCESG